MDTLRVISGVFVGSGALILLWKGENVAAVGLLGTMLGFFVGEKNGQKTASK